MNDRLRKAFDEIHAEEELKQKAKQFLGCTAFPEKRRIFHLPRYAFAVLCLLFIFAAFGSYQMYFIPKSAISIDINPSFELEINRFDQVIAVKGYNAEGEELAASLDVKFLKYMDALERILCDDSIRAYLSSDEELSITVVSSDEAQCGKMLSAVQAFTEENAGIYCYTASSDDAHSAHEIGLSCGKYRAYQELTALDSDITPEEVQGMTMKEIHNCIEALSDDTLNAGEESAGRDYEGGHHSQGHGYGHGNSHE